MIAPSRFGITRPNPSSTPSRDTPTTFAPSSSIPNSPSSAPLPRTAPFGCGRAPPTAPKPPSTTAWNAPGPSPPLAKPPSSPSGSTRDASWSNSDPTTPSSPWTARARSSGPKITKFKRPPCEDSRGETTMTPSPTENVCRWCPGISGRANCIPKALSIIAMGVLLLFAGMANSSYILRRRCVIRRTGRPLTLYGRQRGREIMPFVSRSIG
mmetsp:Transcript_13695/g.29083  ORF Transcript_13695/g.29083 Transcript_13695/m.29083 type:complete len:211 (+) Transcript_13695:748-1380(+)